MMKELFHLRSILIISAFMAFFSGQGFSSSDLPAGRSEDEGIAIEIWPEGYLGEGASSRGVIEDSRGDNIIRVTDVEIPSMVIYRAPGNSPGPAVLILPGGGFTILAMDLEGTEIAEWLNSLGITAAILKYRVPLKPDEAFQDTQRALGLLRHKAGNLAIDPARIGVIGFSAGGRLAARLSTGFNERAYEPVDEVDSISCRPDFTMLVYPYLLDRDGTLADELEVTADTPPAILIHAQDDRVKAEGSIYYFMELRKAGVPSELHVFPSGGHGYGLRGNGHAVTGWPDLCETWLSGILE